MNAASPDDAGSVPTPPSVLDMLVLEAIDRDLYRSTLLFPDALPLYGGQVAAQALLAAGGTVPSGRLPHSLHGYFLRRGDAARPTVFEVDRDRDGRSFSARRVVAVQDGEVIFNGRLLRRPRARPRSPRARAARRRGARPVGSGGVRPAVLHRGAAPGSAKPGS